MAECDCEIEIKDKSEKIVLQKLFGVNIFMFAAEIIFGYLAASSALMADSLDMLADASVYAISIFAIGKAAQKKIRAAFFSGILQLVLGLGVLFDIIRKFITGYEPVSFLMMATALVAFIANYYCLALIQKHREGEIHMRASWIFTKNDLIANAGVIVAGGLVYLLNSHLPDLIAGLIISSIIIHGSIKILRDSLAEKKMTLKEESSW